MSQGTGSGGATNFLSASTSGGALEGNTGTADTGIKIPFGVLGAYDNGSSSPFGIGVLGISTTGYAVAAESLANQPSIIAYSGGSGIGLESTSSAAGAGDSIYSEAKGSGNGITAVADNGGFGAEISAQSGNGVYATSVSGDAITDTSVRLAAVPVRKKHGASAAAYVPVDRKAMQRPIVRRAPALDPSFARSAADLRSAAIRR